ncbi:putative disease resistance protein RGA3 [Ananas comosus]|uniref:Putative disease resistance protein RGA3 n=1 Tax=Ananas comosus TaxID=4615 RepID=A0A199VU05_ANACO|nr:putative disease resistance protein RGA3 [Ananas comosus]
MDAIQSAAVSAAEEEFRLRSSFGEDRGRLERTLRKSRILIDRAERWSFKDERLAQHLTQLKDAAYDAEDLLDDIDYQDQQKKIQAQQSQAICRRTDRWLLSRRTNSIWSRRGTEKSDIENDNESVSAPAKRRKKENVSVLSIYGIGGVGKTTLAQVVYNDERVVKHFDLKIWVCVSDNFDVNSLSKEIIDNAGKGYEADRMNLSSLQATLKEIVMAHRFLLILDDVWNEDSREWQKFYASLSYGQEGSIILVTTRTLKVANIAGTVDPILLEGLSGNVYWEFFKSCAFRLKNPKDYPGLEKIGIDIAAKLKGSPLAAKTLGVLLNEDMDAGHWTTILNSELWELPQKEGDILPALRLSYLYLLPHLKRCFSFCSIFPKDYEFKRSDLTSIWVAEGFVIPQGNMLLEDIATMYLRDLTSRLHNLRKLYLKEAIVFKFKVRKGDKYKIGELKHMTQLRGCLHIKKLENVESKEDACQAELDNKPHLDELILEWSWRSRNFHHDTDVLEGLQPHKKLKKLEIRHYGGTTSPSWLRPQTLNCLSELHIFQCSRLMELPCLPPSVTSLVLDNVGLKSLPRLWDECQDSTTESKTQQGGDNSSSSSSRSNRSSLLRNLYILLCSELTSLEGWLMPHYLPSLEAFTVENCENLTSLPPDSFKDFVSLKSMKIVDCPMLACRRELILPPSINEVVLNRCGYLDRSLPGCLQNLKSLTRLVIHHSPHITSLPEQVMCQLKSLESLSIVECEELSSLGGLGSLASLKDITIRCCPKLADSEPPMFDFSDEVQGAEISLSIDRTTLLKVQSLRNLVPFIRELEIFGSDEPEMFVGEDRELLRRFKSLKYLYIWSCQELNSLPTELHRLTSLQVLSIQNCFKIHFLPENGLPASLAELDFRGCNEEFTRQLKMYKSQKILKQEFYNFSAEMKKRPRSISGRAKSSRILKRPARKLPEEEEEEDDEERVDYFHNIKTTALLTLRYSELPMLDADDNVQRKNIFLHDSHKIHSSAENGLFTSLTNSDSFHSCRELFMQQFDDFQQTSVQESADVWRR